MSLITTSNSERRPAFRFARRALLFALPLLVPILVLEWCLLRTGDLLSLEDIVARQMERGDILFGSGYHGDREYQLSMMTAKKAEILVLGSSRVLQIRDFMFHPHEQDFYNAGRTVNSLDDLDEVVARFEKNPELRPRVIILGIDPNWMIDREKRTQSPDTVDFHFWSLADHASILRTYFFTPRARFSFRALRTGANGPSPHYGYRAIGNLALSKGSGFRWDGSRQYDPEILIAFRDNPVYSDREDPPMVARVARRIPPYDRGNPDPRFLDELARVIERLETLEIELRVILPTFSDEALEAIEGLASWRELWQSYRTELPDLLIENQISFVDAVEHKSLGSDDLAMFDGVHPSEVIMAKAVLALLDQTPEASYLNTVDRNQLRARLEREGVIPLSLDPPR